MNIPEKNLLNNPLNWILPWNEWMTHILNQYLPLLMKKPLFFCLFWTLFGQFLGTFPILPVSMIPWLLNWIIFWIESAEFFFDRIIIWIESWVKQYWIEYEYESFFGKIQTLIWIRLGIGHHYLGPSKHTFGVVIHIHCGWYIHLGISLDFPCLRRL